MTWSRSGPCHSPFSISLLRLLCLCSFRCMVSPAVFDTSVLRGSGGGRRWRQPRNYCCLASIQPSSTRSSCESIVGHSQEADRMIWTMAKRTADCCALVSCTSEQRLRERKAFPCIFALSLSSSVRVFFFILLFFLISPRYSMCNAQSIGSIYIYVLIFVVFSIPSL